MSYSTQVQSRGQWHVSATFARESEAEAWKLRLCSRSPYYALSTVRVVQGDEPVTHVLLDGFAVLRQAE